MIIILFITSDNKTLRSKNEPLFDYKQSETKKKEGAKLHGRLPIMANLQAKKLSKDKHKNLSRIYAIPHALITNVHQMFHHSLTKNSLQSNLSVHKTPN